MVYTAKVYHNDPRVEVIEKVITQDICDHFIALGVKDLAPSTVLGEGEENAFDYRRTSRNCWIPHNKTDITFAIAKKISEIVAIPVENAELFQLIHYGENQEYQPHFDAFDPETPAGKHHLKRGGQRLKTALIYFNDVQKGGGTIFPEIDLIVKAKMGRMVVFENCYAGTIKPHKKSLHGGMPVIKGEKWAANLWFREGVFV
jgi:prolyl 4-hydroxylase